MFVFNFPTKKKKKSVSQVITQPAVEGPFTYLKVKESY